MKNKFSSSLLLSALAMALLGLSSASAQQSTFTGSDYLCKHHNFPEAPGGGGGPGIAASNDGQHFVAIASDNDHDNWSCYSSELDPVSNMSHGWKKRATFVGAYFYGITYTENHESFIITGKKDGNSTSPIILTSGDNGASWVERRPLSHVAVGSDFLENEFSYTDLMNDASFGNKLGFISIGSEDINDADSFFVFSFLNNNNANDVAVGSDFIAIASEDFTFAAFVPAGSDNDNTPAWISSHDLKDKKHHGVYKHKNGSVYWDL